MLSRQRPRASLPDFRNSYFDGESFAHYAEVTNTCAAAGVMPPVISYAWRHRRSSLLSRGDFSCSSRHWSPSAERHHAHTGGHARLLRPAGRYGRLDVLTFRRFRQAAIDCAQRHAFALATAAPRLCSTSHSSHTSISSRPALAVPRKQV